jgi:alpha-soluble NSF attachment protein
MLKVAQYAAELEDYEKAIQIYESVAGSCLDSSLLKYSAKDYFFRASLCHLSVDLLNATHAMEKYAQLYPAFQDSREFKLIKVSWKLSHTEHIIKTFFSRFLSNISKSKTSMASLTL